MGKLIDADKAVKILENIEKNEDETGRILAKLVKGVLLASPAVDAVPVTRCKNCRFYAPNLPKPVRKDSGACCFPGTPYGIHPSQNFFCACAEPVEKAVESVDK